MRNTKLRPTTVGQVLAIEFLQPLNIETSQLADAMGVHRNTPTSTTAQYRPLLQVRVCNLFVNRLGYIYW
jgi:plasmid maintenance system antidote protein VapI